MRRPGAIIAIAVLAALGAEAQETKLPGLEAYRRGEYDRAAKELRPAAESSTLPSGERARARMYLAAALHALGELEAVRANLRALSREHPDARLDPTIFDPELVALAEQLRAEEEEARVRAATPAPVPPPQAEEAKTAVPEPSPAEARPVAVRLGLFALADVAGRPSATAGLSAGVVLSSVELGLRAFPGQSWGVGAEAAYLFGSSRWQPRLGARATLYPSLPRDGAPDPERGPGFGAGLVAGARLRLTDALLVGADAGAELNQTQAAARYRQLSIVLSGGVQLEL